MMDSVVKNWPTGRGVEVDGCPRGGRDIHRAEVREEESDLFRGAEVLFTCSGPTAPLADEPGVFDQFLVIVEVRFEIPDVLEQAKMFLVSWMGHFDFSHFFPSLANNVNKSFLYLTA
jgi:hypothetical protein